MTGDEQLLDELRGPAFAIAYRMLGSVAEAEDVVQEALMRVHRALQAGERLESPRAYVATVVTRLAIDELRSARALHGAGRVARTLAAWGRQGARIAGATIRPVEVNGQPGALIVDGEGSLISVMALDIAVGQIQGVASIVNPDKLAHLGRVADMRALLERRER